MEILQPVPRETASRRRKSPFTGRFDQKPAQEFNGDLRTRFGAPPPPTLSTPHYPLPYPNAVAVFITHSLSRGGEVGEGRGVLC